MRLLIVLFSLVSVQALGYQNNHEYNLRSRPTYGKNVYVSQNAQYTLSNATSTLASSEKTDARFTGYALQTSVGAEFMRFINVGLYYSNVQQSNSKDSRNELRNHELGAEGKIVLTNPIANLNIIGSVFGSHLEHVSGMDRVKMIGQGYSYGLEVNHYVSTSVSVSVLGKQVVADYRDKSDQGNVRGVSFDSMRFGAGINIWL